jgi:hypothetical protein
MQYRRRADWAAAIAVAASLCLAPTKAAWGQTRITAVPIRARSRAPRTVSEMMAAEAARAAAPWRPLIRPEMEPPDRKHLPQNPNAVSASQWSAQTRFSRLVAPSVAAQTLGIQFDGATGPTETNAFPPDTMGVVGPTQFTIFLNGRIRTFNKTTGAADGALNISPDTFFASVTTPPGVNEVTFTSDPNVRYDRLSKRWFFTIIDVTISVITLKPTRANRVLIAVSDAASNGTITGSTTFSFIEFLGDPTNFTDYPSLGIDANALYIGADMFTVPGAFVNTNAYVIPKTPLLNHTTPVVWSFSNLIVGATGPFAPRGVDNPDPSNIGVSAIGYFIGVDASSASALTMRRVTNPGSTSSVPTMSGNITIATPLTTAFPLSVPHLGNTDGTDGDVDALDDRLFAAAIRNGRLWTAHNIGVDNSGAASASPTRDGARWYEVQNLNSSPSVRQSGTLYDNTSPNDTSQRTYWIPTITVSGQGHSVLGCSIAGANEHINAFVTGRLANDPLGTLRAGPGGVSLAGYTSSSTAYNPPGDTPGFKQGPRRWGDYSATSVDPNDDMTMWTIQEYCNGTNTYGVRIAQLKAPPPAVPSSPSPSSVPQNISSTPVTIVGDLSSNADAGFFDPGPDTGGPGFSNRINASVTGGVTVNSITCNNPTSVTLNISTVGAAIGAQSVTVCNPDGQCRTGANILTVSAPLATATPTLTSTPTRTFTATATLTATPTRTFTPTPTVTPTPTPTPTVTPTATTTPTPVPTATFTVTSTPTPTPVPTGMSYFTVTPCRIIDTRNPVGTLGGPALVAGANRDFPITSTCGVPATAVALEVNVTITLPTASGSLTVFTAGTPNPMTATIDYSAGQTRANNAIVVPNPPGNITVNCNQGSGTVHFIMDVNGYFQ